MAISLSFIVFLAVFSVIVYVFLTRLLGRPRSIDQDAPCPACGHTSGHLHWERRVLRAGEPETPVVTHTCHICSFMWHDLCVGVPRYPRA